MSALGTKYKAVISAFGHYYEGHAWDTGHPTARTRFVTANGRVHERRDHICPHEGMSREDFISSRCSGVLLLRDEQP